MHVRSLLLPLVLSVACLGLISGCASSGATSSDAPSSPSTTASGGSGTSNDGSSDLKPFRQVIPADATTDGGLVTTHRVKKKLYFEIPDSLLNREILMVSRSSRTPTGLGYGGQKVNTQVLRWERRDDQVLLRVVSYENTANPDDPVYRAVQNSNLEPIIHAAPIEALNADSTGVVVDVTSLFTSDVPALGLPKDVRQKHQVRRLDEGRTYLSGVKSFPQNTDVEVVLTYQSKNPPSNASTNTLTVEMNHSMVLLPSDPMTPRLCDDRVGYFGVERINYSADAQKAAEECFITRWRLEPSDPEAFARGELVEPVEPIVYYIDPATPEKWRPYLKQGIEDWQAAFESAGFKNAIRAKDPPTAAEDSTFDPDDVRYSVIRYFASETQNASGPHVHDPRTGEILESDINWYHNVMNLLRNWFFVQTAAANPDARGRTFSDEVMGQLIRFVAAHEVGHTLGLPHNWASSHAVPVDSLRSPSYTATHGTAPSLMDYARFNYVAQPGDGVTQFMPRIGPYDLWSIEWGYRPIPDAASPADEAQTLDAWILEKTGDPTYFYGRQTLTKVDPRSQNEDLSRDAVTASRLGTENLKRVVDNLVAWTSDDGADYETLEELYGEVVAQWKRYASHVGHHVGGVYETPKTYAQDGPVYEPVPAAEQRRAMEYMVDDVLATPTWLVDARVLRRFEHAGTLERVREAQYDALKLVLDPQRMARLLEAEAVEGPDAYPLPDMMSDLRSGVWAEARTGEDVDPFRRNVQRGYLARMEHLLDDPKVESPPEKFAEYFVHTPVDVAQSDIQAHVRAELQTLRQQVADALRGDVSRATEIHYADVLARIDRILDPTTD